jgi:CHAT domain-containing protein/Tfp pilus assembly protein PilF
LFIVLFLDWSICARQNNAKPSAATGTGTSESQPLLIGKAVERQLQAGESHTYELTLQAQQYIKVVIDQRGIDVVGILLAPDGKEMIKMDSPNGRLGPEVVKAVATTAGTYKLVILSEEKNAPAGRYEVEIKELRKATAQDTENIEADQLTAEAEQLRQALRYDEAMQRISKALEIRERNAATPTPEAAETYSVCGGIYLSRFEYSRAEPMFQRAQAIAEKTLGTENPEVADALNNLALTYDFQGDYAKAEPLYQRALAIKEKALGAENPALASVLNNFAGMYRLKGDYQKAEPYYLRALAMFEKANGETHPNVGVATNNLAVFYRDKGDYEKAIAFFQRSLSINEMARGSEHPTVAQALNNLALVYYAQGNYQTAKQLLQRALTIFEKAFGAEHPNVAKVLDNLANIYLLERAYEQAEPLIQRALASREKIFGADSPLLAQSLNTLVLYYEAKGETAKALALLARINDITERNIATNLTTGSERQKLLYLTTFAGYSNRTISLNQQAALRNTESTRIALLSVLRTKGRALDAMSDSLALLRRRALPEDQTLIDQLASTRAQLALATSRTPSKETLERFRQNLKALQEKIEKLENQISARSLELRNQLRQITLADVQQAVPKRAALVEYIVYYPFQATAEKAEQRFRSPHYAAYVLPPEGAPISIDLGETNSIDAKIESFRNALRDKHRKDVKTIARTVDEAVMAPVRRLLGSTSHLFLSPDGALNLIPFAALVDEDGQYLVKRYLFTYLTSGRDLLRLQTTGQKKRAAAMIFANPDFNNGGSSAETGTPTDSRIAQRVEAASDSPLGPRLAGVQLKALNPLPGSAREGKKLAKLLPGSVMLTGAAATEAALKNASRPEILHIATHGGFLDDRQTSTAASVSSRMLIRDDSASGNSLPPDSSLDNSLLRSSLFLAGANLGRSGSEDGVLTALEATGLDLLGTKLVVLSACDTGVGEVKNGEGVYGLRRALALAGSESQVISLWTVSDKGTSQLMIDYYKRLREGEGRSAALRQAQLKMLDSKRQHPFYWASFIQSGEWASLDGKRLN